MKHLFICLLGFCSVPVLAQWNEKVMRPVSLQNLDFFKPASANWKIEGKATGLRDVNYNLETSPGTGVLVNKPDAVKKDNLFSKEEYSDLDIEFEFMMPKGSNSGIYLMGRYEIQLFDSWGKENPMFSDCGGVYQRWAPERGKGREGFEGVAPLQNECKAPGLWQSMRISFEAPRFSRDGIKTSNAKFVTVWLNGVRIHRNVEVSGPTRAAAFQDEVERGPIMLQGDHGPIAFRNISIAPAGNPLPEFRPFEFKVYQGAYRTVEEHLRNQPVRSGKNNFLDKADAGSDDDFLLVYQTDFTVKSPGNYTFNLEMAGKGVLKIDNKTIIDTIPGGFYWQKKEGEVQLSSGNHSFTLYYLKLNPKNKPALGLTYNGPGIKWRKLHSEGSINTSLPGGQLNLPIEIHPYVQRSFVMHKGSKKAYAINVCTPQGIHYTLNATTGRLIRAWRSNVFGDAQSMWSDRGSQQTLLATGAALELMDGALVGSVPSAENYPDSVIGKFQYLGYQESKKETPVFSYETANGIVTTQFSPISHGLKAEIGFQPSSGLFHCLAEGKLIEKASDGSYRVDDSYYLLVDKDTDPLLKISTRGNMQRLIVPLTSNQNKVGYVILW